MMGAVESEEVSCENACAGNDQTPTSRNENATQPALKAPFTEINFRNVAASEEIDIRVGRVRRRTRPKSPGTEKHSLLNRRTRTGLRSELQLFHTANFQDPSPFPVEFRTGGRIVHIIAPLEEKNPDPEYKVSFGGNAGSSEHSICFFHFQKMPSGNRQEKAMCSFDGN